MERNVKFGRLTAQDALAFRTFRLAALEMNPDSFPRTVAEERAKPLEYFEQRITECFGYGATNENSTLVGTIFLAANELEKRRHIGEIKGLFVMPDYRGQGIAWDLMHLVETQARRMQLEQLQLYVTAINDPAIALYQKCGYEAFGKVPRSMKTGPDQYLDGIYMVKFLDQPT